MIVNNYFIISILITLSFEVFIYYFSLKFFVRIN